MAQWSRADKTLYAKIVYYGPAFGGKTTNLESLHRLTDPRGEQPMLSVNTSDDRTLFFDLLPFDLGDVLGYQVAMKLYTVPGQVRYDMTRRVVLSGADAVIFVADSSPGREEQNRWSLQNLQMNMRSLHLDPGTVPVVFQANKQDLVDAVAPPTVASWLRLGVDRVIPAVAIDGRGVIESFRSASRAMLERLLARADQRTQKQIDVGRLNERLDEAFAPCLARAAAVGRDDDPGSGPRLPLVVDGTDIEQSSLETSLRLGEGLAEHAARSLRLEREIDGLRRVSETVRALEATFDAACIGTAVLETAAAVLDAARVSLVRAAGEGLRTEGARPAGEEPLGAVAGGRGLLGRIIAGGRVSVIEDAATECADPAAAAALGSLRVALVAPVDGERAIVAWAADADRGFGPDDARFLGTLAGHLAVGLEKARLYRELGCHRSELERQVAARTEQLRQAYEELKSLDAMKDRFLNNLSHEMKTPLTAILSSAVFLRDYPSDEAQRAEMMASIIAASGRLQTHLDNLFRLVGLEAEVAALRRAEVSAAHLVDEAIQLAGHVGVRGAVDAPEAALHCDEGKVVRALANLIDNAVKFSGDAGSVELVVGVSADPPGRTAEMEFSVLDRGPGVAPSDRERIFAPFEQGGDPLTGKPDGVGLGLYEARTIARRHGGELRLDEREGGGAVFRLCLPLGVPAPTGEAIGA